MFINDDSDRAVLAELLAAANLAIAGSLVVLVWGLEGLFWMALAGPLLLYVALATAVMLLARLAPN